MKPLGTRTVRSATAIAIRVERADPTAYTEVEVRLLAIASGALEQSVNNNAPLEWRMAGSSFDTYYAHYRGRLIEATTGLFKVRTGSNGSVPQWAYLSSSRGPEAAVLVAAIHGAAKASAEHVRPTPEAPFGPKPHDGQLDALDRILD